MKKNLFNGLLMLTISCVGVGTFSSCTDDNGDDLSKAEANLNNQISNLQSEIDNLKKCKDICNEKITQLEGQIAQLNAELATLKNNHDADIANLQEQINKLKAQITELQNDVLSLKSNVTSLDARVTELEALKGKVEELQNQMDELGNQDVEIEVPGAPTQKKPLGEVLKEIYIFMEAHNLATNEVITAIQSDITALQNSTVDKDTFNELQNVVNDIKNDLATKYAELNTKAEDGVKAWAWIELNKNRLDALESADEAIKAQHKADIDNLKALINDLSAKLDAEVIRLDGRIDVVDGKIVSLETRLGALEDRVLANEQAIQEINNKINKLLGLADRLNKLVTGIINQGTNNPVFGSLNLPLNVRSNMLIALYGNSETNYTFPSQSSAAEYNGEQVITAQDVALLQASGNFQSLTIKPGEVLMDKEEGNAGTVFVTINPNNVDFTGVSLPMVNSQDNESGIKLSGLVKSDKVLSFGYSRAANNGFYEAKATLAPEKINDVKVNIEPGLKSAFKDALVQHGKKDFANLAKILYRQFTDILPANGLKASWTAPDGEGNVKEYAVYSTYDLAATAFSPLSFKFMEGQSVGKHLPIISPISEFEFDKSKFTFDLDVPTIKVNDVEVTFSLDHISLNRENDIEVSIVVPTWDSVLGKYVDKTYTYPMNSDIDKVLTDIAKSINLTIDHWNIRIKEEFETAMNNLKNDVNKQVNDMMNDVAGQIDKNLGNMIDEINKEINDALGGYMDHANNLIGKYNKVANKLNKFLDDPNHMLQSMMCYKGTDGDFHQLSNSKGTPSLFKLCGGNAISLYPTSYSAEIVAPAFRKFIAVTNVWNVSTGMDANSDATCKSLLIKANKQPNMNQPITGKAHRVAFAADKAGYTYEIVYSALDYRGYTSTRKYYVTVK